MASERIPAAWIALSALAAVACGTVAWLALAQLSTPSGFGAERSALAGQVERLEKLAKASARPGGYGPQAVCPGLGEADLDATRRLIIATAAQSNVSVTDLVARAPDSVDGWGRIAPVAVRAQMTGPYEGIVRTLETLAGGRPEIFLDSLDLISGTPNATLKFSGKVFCWTSARP